MAPSKSTSSKKKRTTASSTSAKSKNTSRKKKAPFAGLDVKEGKEGARSHMFYVFDKNLNFKMAISAYNLTTAAIAALKKKFTKEWDSNTPLKFIIADRRHGEAMTTTASFTGRRLKNDTLPVFSEFTVGVKKTLPSAGRQTKSTTSAKKSTKSSTAKKSTSPTSSSGKKGTKTSSAKKKAATTNTPKKASTKSRAPKLDTYYAVPKSEIRSTRSKKKAS